MEIKIGDLVMSSEVSHEEPPAQQTAQLKRNSSLQRENSLLRSKLAQSQERIQRLHAEKRLLIHVLNGTNVDLGKSPFPPHQSVSVDYDALFRRISSYMRKNCTSVSAAQAEAAEPSRKRRAVSETSHRKTANAAKALHLDSHGRPVLPLNLGILTVTSLGRVISDRPGFHSKRYIWPVGFESHRQYWSTVDSESQTTYVSRIVDGGDAPQFEILPSDIPGRIFTSPTSTGAWSAVIKAANQIRHKDASNTASGPDYFGFSHPIVAKLIEELPGADHCTSYVSSTAAASSQSSGKASAADPHLAESATEEEILESSNFSPSVY